MKNRAAIDAIVAGEVASRTLDELSTLLNENEVGYAPIFSIADVFADPQFAAREAIVSVDDAELGPVKMQAVVPRFSHSPGRVTRTGPAPGEHNDEVFGDWLGLDADARDALRAGGVI